MRSLVAVVLFVAGYSEVLWSQSHHELPVIADRVADIVNEMHHKWKLKYLAFVDDDAAWNTGHGDLGCNGIVHVIEPAWPEASFGPVYIGGAFDSIDGMQLRGIAHLYQGTLTEVGGGISGGAVYAISATGTDTVFVAGNFKFAGGDRGERRWRSPLPRLGPAKLFKPIECFVDVRNV